MMSLTFAHLRASTASLRRNKCSPYTRYASALFSAISLYLLLIFAKAPLSAIICSVEFSVSYGGLLHFVFYHHKKTKCSTALSACIFLPLLLYFGGVFTLPLQKPRMLSQAAKRIPLLSLSVGWYYICTHPPYRRN